jgi:hypothetical protein
VLYGSFERPITDDPEVDASNSGLSAMTHFRMACAVPEGGRKPVRITCASFVWPRNSCFGATATAMLKPQHTLVEHGHVESSNSSERLPRVSPEAPCNRVAFTKQRHQCRDVDEHNLLA